MRSRLLLAVLSFACSEPKSLETRVFEYTQQVCNCSDVECVNRASAKIAPFEAEIAERTHKYMKENPTGVWGIASSSYQDSVVTQMRFATACVLTMDSRSSESQLNLAQ